MYEFSYDEVEEKVYFGYPSTIKIPLDNSINELITVDDDLQQIAYFSYQFTEDKELHFTILNFDYFAPTILLFNKYLLEQYFINKIFIKSQHFQFTLKDFQELFSDNFFYYSNFIISIQDYSDTQFSLNFNYLFNTQLLTKNQSFIDNLYSKLNLEIQEPTPQIIQDFKNISLNGNGSKFQDNQIVKVKGFNQTFKVVSSFNALIENHKFEVIYLLEHNLKYTFFYEKLLE